MKAHWFIPAILLAAVTAPAQAQFAIDLTAGPNWTSISAAPIGFSKSSDIGYFVGGRIRFGHGCGHRCKVSRTSRLIRTPR